MICAVSLAVFALLFAVLCLAPTQHPVVGRPDAELETTRAWPSSDRLTLKVPDGNVIIRGAKRQDIQAGIHVRAFAEDRDTVETAKAYLESMITVTQQAGSTVVITEPDERPDCLHVLAFYDVEIPRGTDLDISISNGNVFISGECGDVRVAGGNTDVQVEDPQGMVRADTVNGRIVVTRGTAGSALHTVNGNIHAYDVGGASIEAKTVNGSIHARLARGDTPSCDLTSQNGGIILELDKKCSAALTARTRRGFVRSNLPLDTSSGALGRRRIEGVIGTPDTDAEISLDTLNGDILIAGSSS